MWSQFSQIWLLFTVFTMLYLENIYNICETWIAVYYCFVREKIFKIYLNWETAISFRKSLALKRLLGIERHCSEMLQSALCIFQIYWRICVDHNGVTILVTQFVPICNTLYWLCNFVTLSTAVYTQFVTMRAT